MTLLLGFATLSLAVSGLSSTASAQNWSGVNAGLMRRRELLPVCRTLLAVAPPPAEANPLAAAVWQCPICGSPMRVVELLTALQIQQEQMHQVYILDSS